MLDITTGGVVTLKASANYETKAAYNFDVIAHDGHNDTTQSVVVTVHNMNDAPTGGVTISGTPIQGETLTASNDLSDEDGLGTIVYQWKAGAEDISGATGESYILTASEVGKRISVTASYMDGHGTNESVSSTETAAVDSSHSGLVMDGYLKYALVWVDADNDLQLDWTDTNSNGKWDSGEGECWTITDNTGQFTGLVGSGTVRITANPIGSSTNPLPGIETIDISTNKPFTGSYSAPSGSTVVTPLTTLIVAAGGNEAAVKTALGLDPLLDLSTYDPVAEALREGADPAAIAMAIKVQSATIQIANIIDLAISVTQSGGADSASISGIADDVASALWAGSLDLADSSVISGAIDSVVQNVVTDPDSLNSIDNTLGAIADAAALVNNKIETVADNAATPGGTGDVMGSLKEIVSAQIVAQDVAKQADDAIQAGDPAKIITSSGTIGDEMHVAESQVRDIYVNHAPTGSPVIVGTLSPGETLTINNTIADFDGLGTMSYQWQAGGVDISGATSNTFKLTASQINKTITVQAHYTDEHKTAESVSYTTADVVDNAPTSLSDVTVTLKGSSDSGISHTDGITNITTPTVKVDLTGKPLVTGDIVQIIDSNHGNAVVGSYTVSNADAATGLAVKEITLTTALGEDPHALVTRLIDAALHTGLASKTAATVTIDTTAPLTTVSALSLSHDTGVSSTDFITNIASQTINGTLSAGLVAGQEMLYGSVDNGSIWTDITAKASGTAITWDGVTLSGSSTISFEIRDLAGNVDHAGSHAYAVDTVAPTTIISDLDITQDKVTGMLSAGLDTGELLYGSLDNGVHWTDISSKVSGQSIVWDGLTLSGDTTLKFQVRDAAGNSTTFITTLTIDPSVAHAIIPDSSGNPTLSVDLPDGLTLVHGMSDLPGLSQQLSALVDSIIPGDHSFQNGIDAYVSSLNPTEQYDATVRTLVFSSDTIVLPPHQLVVTGIAGHQEALVIDIRGLPAGSQIDLQEVEFAIIIGEDITIRGGAGNNIVFAGSGHQDIKLGPGTDVLHGGDGNDNIASNGGDDQLYGDGGNDTLTGAEDNDFLDGGTGDDTAVFRGNFADYTISYNAETHQYTVADKVAGRDGTDTVINVEHFHFADVTSESSTFGFADPFASASSHDGGMGAGVVLAGVGALGILAWAIF